MSKLYLIPTPIGNLEDISLRALRLLGEVAVILAEDTRTSSKLLKHYNINTPMQSYHLFNEHKVVDSWVQRIKGGTTVALITDAGTPAISDPGFLLARACIAEEVAVECLPGATPHKLLKTLADFITTFGADRKASLSRELTKLHEETLRGTLEDLQLAYTDKIIKGEMVLVVAGKK